MIAATESHSGSVACVAAKISVLPLRFGNTNRKHPANRSLDLSMTFVDFVAKYGTLLKELLAPEGDGCFRSLAQHFAQEPPYRAVFSCWPECETQLIHRKTMEQRLEATMFDTAAEGP